VEVGDYVQVEGTVRRLNITELEEDFDTTWTTPSTGVRG